MSETSGENEGQEGTQTKLITLVVGRSARSVANEVRAWDGGMVDKGDGYVRGQSQWVLHPESHSRPVRLGKDPPLDH